MNHATPHSLRLIATLGITAALSAQTPPADSADETVRLENYVVTTGSNIPTAADALAFPITVIDSTQIERIGEQGNLLELLRKGSPLFSGNGNLGTSNSNTASINTMGGAQIQLRNLDTLVLINGRRVANSGANARSGRSFVDLNQIPIAAVDRIEILSDGASAIYGSDAVGGVVNLILKSNYNGAEISGRTAFSTADGDYSEQSYSLTAGAANQRASLTVSANYAETDPLLQSDRAYSQITTRGRSAFISGAVFTGSTPSHFLNPALNTPSATNPTGLAATAPNLAALVANGTYENATTASIANTFNLAPYVTLLHAQEQKTATANGTFKLIGRQLEFFGDVLYSETDSQSQLAAQAPTTALTVPAGAPFNPLTTSVNVAFRYLPAPRVFKNHSALTRYTAGLRGEITPRLRWEAAYTDNRNTINATTSNVLYLPNVNSAIAGGFDQNGNVVAGGAYSRVDTTYGGPAPAFVIQPAFDPFARPAAVNRQSLNYVLGNSSGSFEAGLSCLDAKLTGELFNLPGGPIGFAVGGDRRNETLIGRPDANTAAGLWTGATSFQRFNRERDVDAAFAEVKVPLTGHDWKLPFAHALDLSVAYRTEDYSDLQDSRSTVPKYTLRWLPFDEQLALRYTYSEAFSAPTLFSLYGPATLGSTNQTAIPTALGSQFAGQAQQRSGSNPNLRPTDSRIQSLGFVASPKFLRGLTATVTYVHIDQTDLTGSPGVVTILQSVNQLGPASPYINDLTLGAFPGSPGARPITQVNELSTGLANGTFGVSDIYINNASTNVAGQKIRSLDFALDYESPETALGRFDFNTAATFYLDYQFQALPEQPYYEYAGTATSIQGTGTQGTLPGYRTFSSLGWRFKNWELRFAHTYIPSVDDLGTGGHAFATNPASIRARVDSYNAWDISAGYRFKSDSPRRAARWLNGTSIKIGVNNLTDEMPPDAPRAFVDSGADTSTYGPIGRLYTVRASKKF